MYRIQHEKRHDVGIFFDLCLTKCNPLPSTDVDYSAFGADRATRINRISVWSNASLTVYTFHPRRNTSVEPNHPVRVHHKCVVFVYTHTHTCVYYKYSCVYNTTAAAAALTYIRARVRTIAHAGGRGGEGTTRTIIIL